MKKFLKILYFLPLLVASIITITTSWVSYKHNYVDGGVAALEQIFFFYLLLPLTILITSYLVGRKNAFKEFNFLFILYNIIIYLNTFFCTFPLGAMKDRGEPVRFALLLFEDNYGYNIILLCLIPAFVGLLLGIIIRKVKEKKNLNKTND